MELAQLIAATFQFHRVVYISITQKCPIECRHCFVESGPSRVESVAPDALETWLRGFEDARHVDCFLFSGGEPFANPATLRTGLDWCNRNDRYSIIGTSAFWARSQSAAHALFESYPKFRALWISTDIFHEEFVPLYQLRFAAEAALAHNVDVFYQVVDYDPDKSGFMERFEAEGGVDLVGHDHVYKTPLSQLGRAETLVPLTVSRRGSDLTSIPDGPCPWLGAPWAHEDGALCACPNLNVHREADHPLRLGNLAQSQFSKLSSAAERDDYIQSLRTLGPKGIAQAMPLEEWGWNAAGFRGVSMCDLCHSIASVPGLPDRVREHARAQRLTRRLNAMRVMLYSEIPRVVRE